MNHDSAQTAARASLDEVAEAKLAALERRSLKRQLVTTDRVDAVRAARDGAELVSFSCNDYLGLSQHPDVIAASVEATRRHGAGAGSARLVNGNHPPYAELERKLARLKGTADAIVFGSGYLANVGTIPALVGAADLILLDELAHSCLLAGAELARGTVLAFRHNDVAHAAELLAARRAAHRHCLIVTEGVFSMDGDTAPLAALAALAREHHAWLMTDDAHGFGVLGDGRGSTRAAGLGAADVPLQMGTLSKAAGSYGGYVCASAPVVELLRNRARSFVYATALPPGAVAAASRALDLIGGDLELVRRPLERARLFTAVLGLPAAESPIVAVQLGAAERALEASAALRDAGFLVA
ncbi:MAG TPA: aminotransferase class I/II-fold pyridoxal phosphate-dependent enzyme, partial [Gammaproteobacteria bacterium]|nr:aminotransferase class I/II-fold pyridoxal phosphate-dependent enzyme [Gammaproteobacteria bacterium]